MKICVFGDVHGNFKQFKKLTETKDFLNADIRICLGDMVGLGPYQKQCMDLLSNFEHVMVMGNHEARMTKMIDDLTPEKNPGIYEQFDMYRKQLAPYLPTFEKLPLSHTLEILGKKIYFTHYGWYNNDMANRNPALRKKSLLEQFGLKEDEYDYVVYGHIHSPSETTVGKTKFIDIGSLGLKSPSNYLTIDDENGVLNIQRKQLEFNKNEFLADCKKLDYPKWDQLTKFSYDNKLENTSVVVLVTGGAGYIGTNVVYELATRGYRIVVVDNFSNSYNSGIQKLAEKFSKNIKLYNFDLNDKEKLNEVLVNENINSVIHLAGKKYVAESFEKEDEYYKNNVALTKILLEALKENNVKNLVFSSSITVYGNPETELVDEEQKCSPLSPYAEQKYECEQLIRDWQKETDSRATVLRLSNPIGANTNVLVGDNPKTKQFKGVLPYILDKVKNDKPLKFNGGDHPTKDGTTIRDYIHVENVATAFVNAMEKFDTKFDIYNIGSSEPGYSVIDILNEVQSCLNKKLDYSFGPKREGDVSVFISNNKKARQNIDFNITKNLNDMIKSQIEFEKSLEKEQTQEL